MPKNPKLIDLTGQVIGRWTVHEKCGNEPKGGALWRCVCECGVMATVRGADLRAGKSRSCGCAGSRATIGSRSKRHGGHGSRLYQTWLNMRARCANLSDPLYGGRGIAVCPEWGKFSDFRSWAINSGYRDDLSIERLDVNGSYEPMNCVWAIAQSQSENRRFVAKAPNGRLWVHIARDNGITDSAYRSRLNDGWGLHQASTWPMGKKRRDGNLSRANFLMLRGEMVPATIAAAILGYSAAALYQRAKRKNISLQEALDEMDEIRR